MADAEAFSGKMGDLQKLRVTVVILISQENSRLLSRRQRVAGKEIEVMCAERDLEQDVAEPDHRQEKRRVAFRIAHLRPVEGKEGEAARLDGADESIRSPEASREMP